MIAAIKKITLTHVLLAIIAVFSALNYFRTDRRIHELDQDVDNVVDFTQETSDSLKLIQEDIHMQAAKGNEVSHEPTQPSTR